MNIQLTFINQAQLAPAELQTILLFQKQGSEQGECALVWKVIQNCRYQHFHPLSFSSEFSVSLGDQYGNYSALLPARAGDQLAVLEPNGRRRLQPAAPAAKHRPSGDHIEIRNRSSDQPFDACLFVRGELLARQAVTAADQVLSLQPDCTLWAVLARPGDAPARGTLPGLRNQWRCGDPIPATLLAAATPIALAGVARAHIVLQRQADRLTFAREGVVWA